jgi:hypothetical protein
VSEGEGRSTYIRALHSDTRFLVFVYSHFHFHFHTLTHTHTYMHTYMHTHALPHPHTYTSTHIHTLPHTCSHITWSHITWSLTHSHIMYHMQVTTTDWGKKDVSNWSPPAPYLASKRRKCVYWTTPDLGTACTSTGLWRKWKEWYLSTYYSVHLIW